MRRKRRLFAVLLEPVRLRFIGMSVAGLLLIGLTATAERGAAVFGLSYIMRNQEPPASAAPLPPSLVVETARPTPSASPAPTPVPVPAPGQRPPAAPASSPSPARVIVPISLPLAPPSTAPSPAATASPVTDPRPAGGGPAAPIAPTPTPPPPTAAPLSLRIDTGATSYLFQVGVVVPGDTWTRDAKVTNTGGVSFRYVIELAQTANTRLWTDPNGLTVRITSGATVLYDGPASAAGTISAPNTVAPGANDALRFVFGLPVGADNTFQGLTQDLQLVITATQTP
jgi:hypothetical protein